MLLFSKQFPCSTYIIVYYILFIQEIKDIILNSKESPRPRDLRTKSEHLQNTESKDGSSGSKLTESNSGINFGTPCHGRWLKLVEVGFQFSLSLCFLFCFLLLRKSDEANASSASMVVTPWNQWKKRFIYLRTSCTGQNLTTLLNEALRT